VIEKLKGKFIVFDGPDGSGKTTQRERLGARLADAGLDVVHCKDPGGTTIGNRIRHVLLGYDLSEMDVRCETFLFMASRAQLVGEVIEPAIRAGKTVVCDRFVSATCAYQGAAGYDPRRVIEVARYAIGDTWPDLTFLLDVDIKKGFERTGRSSAFAGKKRRNHTRKHAGQRALFDDIEQDAMEARPLEFHRQVRKMFLQLGEFYPRPVAVINANREADAVHQAVWETLERVDL
jgi:dTMP kinase